ncbi:isoprenyl transferase [Halolactibacillus alkaliphilus]|uniref:Isoprenyl transferase n=1 Tax=Halolactibacillus alkaliphilus TaxID=442899 RepID=A0A511WXF9_9BACI|nr:isoprenyl transferase [Halolactibacillus alkaliphilus]GEN55810.1 isoprenyl transferase [Halolactibacillus alkaliphilus]GGN64842.1 isoprenyl transferase [Halolactibacillus alkaliphilus]SFO64884.1 undecaprenyl diphosphate synthase [Halolactibacillus alkaliphilus]
MSWLKPKKRWRHLFKRSTHINVSQTKRSQSSVTMPHHVAIIMDGNGRWAKDQGYPRFKGHQVGMDNVKRIVKVANREGVKILTIYAFSTENWKRPKAEVDFLMKLPTQFLNVYLPELIEENVRVMTMGHFEQLPEHTKKAMRAAVDRTKDNNGLILNIALNYGSRFEITEAVKAIAEEVSKGDLSPECISEQTISQHLYTHELPDPDLLIRTSGEVRLSNFLLWQLAYSEFWFSPVHWPAFDEEEFLKALHAYACRKRRFGGLNEKEEE